MKGLKLTVGTAAFILLCAGLLYADESGFDGPIDGIYYSSELEYERAVFTDGTMDAFQTVSEMIDSSLELVSSTLWSGVRGILVEGNYAYCSFYNGLVIYDVTDPANPIQISSLEISLTAYYTGNIVKAGNYVYQISESDGLLIIDVSDPYNPSLVSEYVYDGSPRSLYYFSDLIFMCDNNDYIVIFDVSNPSAPDSLISYPFNEQVYTVTIKDTILYAAVDDSGLQIINIADPFNPQFLSEYIAGYSVRNVFVDDTLAYISTSGGGIQVLDISDPTLPIFINQSPPVRYGYEVMVQDSIAYANGYTLYLVNIADINNMQITDSLTIEGSIYDFDYADGLVYIVGGYFGMAIYDVTDPSNITYLGGDQTSGSVRVENIDDTLAYLGCWNYGLRVVDISDIYHPEVIGGYYDVDLDLHDLVIQDNYAYTVGRSGFSIFDIADPTQPQLLFNRIDSSMSELYAVAIQDNLAYVMFYRHLIIYDISDPAMPDSIGGYEFNYSMYRINMIVRDSLLYIPYSGPGYEIFNILNISDPTEPILIGKLEGSSYSSEINYIQLRGDTLYAVGRRPEFSIIDVGDPTSPTIIGANEDIIGGGRQLAIENGTAYIAHQFQGITLMDVTDPVHPYARGNYDTPQNTTDIHVSDSIVFASDWGSFSIFKATSWIGQPDLVIDSLDVISFGPDTVEFLCRFSNIGLQPVDLEGATPDPSDNVKIGAYISADTIPGNGDEWFVGNLNIQDSPAESIYPGQTMDVILKSFAIVDTAFNPYLAVTLDPENMVVEADEDNNNAADIIGFLCYPDLPDPIISINACGDIRTFDEGHGYIYKIHVVNWEDYPDEMFKACPDLPTCGNQDAAPRTFVSVLATNTTYSDLDCYIFDNIDLAGVEFWRWHAWTEPESLYVRLLDRRCNREYFSQKVDVTEVNFPPLIRAIGEPVDDTLFEETEFCFPVYVQNADTVYVSSGDGFYENGWVCFTPQNSGYYSIRVRARNECGYESDYMRYEITIRYLHPTNQWINLYCGQATLNEQALMPGDTIEAFDPRGVLCGRDFVREDGSFGFMAIYRDDTLSTDIDEGASPGDTISFRINSQEVVTVQPVIWTQFGMSYEVCRFYTEQCRNYHLPTGWNLISWNLEYSEPTESFIANFSDCIDIIQGFDNGGRTYDPELPQFSTLNNFDYYHGYWFKLNCDVDFEICGYQIKPEDGIKIYPSWNLVSYWPDDSLPVEEGMNSMAGCLDVVLGYDNGAQTWWIETPAFNTLEYVRPGFGYWVKSFCDTMLIYPGYTGPPDNLPARLFAGYDSQTMSRRWMSVYGSEISLDDKPVEDGGKIEIFAESGILCGRGIVKDRLLKFTPVYGYDNLDRLTSGFPRNGEQITIFINGQKTFPHLTWQSDTRAVDISRRFSTEISPIPEKFALYQNYPNPFNPTTLINFDLPQTSDVTLTIYNILGQKVTTLINGKLEAGAHSITWDGGKQASGIYFYKITTKEFTDSRKMLLLK